MINRQVYLVEYGFRISVDWCWWNSMIRFAVAAAEVGVMMMMTMMLMLAGIHQSSRNRSVLCGGGTRRSDRFAHARRIDGFAFVIGDRAGPEPGRAEPGRTVVASPSHAVHRSRRDRFFNQCLAKPASASASSVRGAFLWSLAFRHSPHACMHSRLLASRKRNSPTCISTSVILLCLHLYYILR